MCSKEREKEGAGILGNIRFRIGKVSVDFAIQ
jgi:hypothetical protein